MLPPVWRGVARTRAFATDDRCVPHLCPDLKRHPTGDFSGATRVDERNAVVVPPEVRLPATRRQQMEVGGDPGCRHDRNATTFPARPEVITGTWCVAGRTWHAAFVRYEVSAEITYVGGQAIPDEARDALGRAVREEVTKADPDVVISDLWFAIPTRNGFGVHASLAGAEPSRLTNPLDALRRVDRALNDALVATGLFEEFDVARARLAVVPGDQGGHTDR